MRPSRFDHGWPNIESSDEMARARGLTCMESQSGKKNIVGIGMVETRRCTRFDLIQIRYSMVI
jgi:hypothetical protein